MAKKTSGKKEMVGKVVSTKMEKTIVVEVENVSPHPKYGKLIKKHRKHMAHLPKKIEVEKGDRVKIQEAMPMSKNKKWIVIEKLN